MNRLHTVVVALALVLATAGVLSSGLAQAALYDRGGGLIYDSQLQITWLQDANYAKTSGYDADGKMDWYAAKTWAANLVYGGYDDWYLGSYYFPNVIRNYQDYNFSYNGTTDVGYNVSSQMYNMYRFYLGLKSPYTREGTQVPEYGLMGYWTATGQRDVGLFKNLQSNSYWFGNESRYVAYPDPTPMPEGYNPCHESMDDSGSWGLVCDAREIYLQHAWAFSFIDGYQSDVRTDQQLYAWAVRSGDGAARAAKDLIVLSHGFQPCSNPLANCSATYDPKGSYLPAIKNAINARLDSSVKGGTTEVVEHNWEQAFVLGTPNGYHSAKQSTKAEGEELGKDLWQKIEQVRLRDPNYNPTIHLIGHSLGTMVNAYAIAYLNGKGIDANSATIQFTILDSPWIGDKDVLQAQAEAHRVLNDPALTQADKVLNKGYFRDVAKNAANDALFFAQTLKKGSVDFVENFYGDGGWPGPYQAYGEPIPGTEPCVGANRVPGCFGLLFPGDNHTDIVNRYAQIVANNGRVGWKTPSLGNSSGVTWDPTDALLADASQSEQWREDWFVNQYLKPQWVLAGALAKDVVGLVGFDPVSGNATLESRSPAGFSFVQALDLAYFLSFDYALDPTLDGTLTLLIDGDQVWMVSGTSKSGHARVSLINYVGEHLLRFEYLADVKGAVAHIDNLSLLNLAPVPEPETWAMWLGGMLALAATRRRRTAA